MKIPAQDLALNRQEGLGCRSSKARHHALDVEGEGSKTGDLGRE